MRLTEGSNFDRVNALVYDAYEAIAVYKVWQASVWNPYLYRQANDKV